MKKFGFLLALAACSPVLYNVPGVREAQASEVVNCRLVGTVVGKPGVFGPLKDIGLRDARRAALEAATNLGANTVVFDPIPEGQDVYELPGQAYVC
ncbi:hypothetical protein [Litoreibacter roseus]|uniref:DUF4156 domain-containing protein n=1 Tax=Litoreibacter roseus TaxID=2601869 RepID=A0A6N6JDJ0_9RHOB|nr:hypothetical protein [Litoreibacter roseus]GFE64017.1 hypothetical protein KIN_10910 [Litoreibacter roseus]